MTPHMTTSTVHAHSQKTSRVFLAHRESEYVEKNKNGQVNLENEWIGRLGFFGFWFQKGTLGQITTKAMILVGQKIFPSSNITSLEKVYDDPSSL